VDALSADRAALWARVAAADFLTVNEKRAAVGYEPVKGGDEFKSAAAVVADLERRYNPDWPSQPRVPAGEPEGGQWTIVAAPSAKDRCIEKCYRLLERPGTPRGFWDESMGLSQVRERMFGTQGTRLE
jgi:hypothetical protein